MKILSTITHALGGIFSRKSAMSAYNAMWGAGVDGLTSREKEIEEPYGKSVWLNAGIKLVTSQMNRVPFGWFADEALATPAPDDAARAAFWKTPSVRLAERVRRADTIEALAGWGLLSGEMIAVLPESWLTAGRTARTEPFTVASPARMTPIRVAAQGDILGWEWLDPSMRRQILIPAQVVRSIFWNPYDDARGLGSYAPAKVEVAGDFYAGEFSRNVAASNGSQPTYITTDGAGLQKDQQDQITAALREKQRRILRGDFAPVFLNGGLKVEEPHGRSVDAAFIAQRIEHRHAIAAALGIPMSMFDLAASYSTGAASDLYRLITLTCEPFGAKVAAMLESIEEARTSQAIWCGFRWGDHPVMQEARAARFENAAKVWATGVPWDILNATHRLEMPEFDGSDTGFLPFNMRPVDSVLTAPEKPPGTAGKPVKIEDPIAAAKLLMGVRIVEPLEKEEPPVKALPPNQSPVTSHQSPPTLTLGARTAKAKDKARTRLWEKHMAAQKPHLNRAHSAVSRVLGKYRRRVLDAVATMELPGKAAGEHRGIFDFVFDPGSFRGDIIGSFRDVLASTLTDAANDAMEEFGSDAPFTTSPDWVRSHFALREHLIGDASDTMHGEILGRIQDGITNGDTIEELARAVKDSFQIADKGRALTIAQTETFTAFGVARQASMEQAGITHKEWVSAQDDRVRDTHAETDGQIVGTEENFHVGVKDAADGGGIEMMHPCAVGAPPEEVINCRCIAVGSLKLNPEDLG